MQCEHCKKRKATLVYRENIHGQIKEFQLCNDCTTTYRQAGELEDISICMENFSSALPIPEDTPAVPLWSLQPSQPSTSPDKACPLCGQTLSNLISTGRVGCETCYVAFSAQLAPLWHQLHGQTAYVGRIPYACHQKKEKQAKISALKEQLAMAVSTQAFEQAAKLRDEINQLEGTHL